MNVTLPMLGQRLRALSGRRFGLAAWLWGEAGVGKTYSSRALLRETPCRSVTLSATLPLPDLICALPRPVRLRAWTRAALDSLQAGQIANVPTADILAALLGQLAPFVLHLEDLHYADDARKALTVQLAAAVAHTRGAALLVSSRPAPPEDWPEGAPVLPLERLSPQDSAALLEAEAGAGLPAGALSWVYERARGNPLFTLEYFRLLARQGHLWNSGDHWRWRAPESQTGGAQSMPVTVEAVIEQGLLEAETSAAAETLVAALAVMPDDATDAHLAAVAGLSATRLESAAAELRRRGVLVRGRFAHPLYREVARQRLHPQRWQDLARRAIAACRDAPQTAVQLIDEARLTAPEAMSLLLQAADAAGAGSVRTRLLARAVNYVSGPAQVQLALRTARELRLDDLPEALRLTQVALDLAPQDGEVLGLYAELLASQGRLAEAEAKLELLPPSERRGAAWWFRLIRLRGLSRNHQGVLEIWQTHPELHPHAEANVRYAVAFACALMDQLEQAAYLAQQTLTWPGLDAATACDLTNVLGVVCYQRGDFAGAAAHQSRAVTLARAARLPHLEAVYLCNRAISLGELGQHHERLADLEGSVRLYVERGQLIQATRVQVTLADAYLDWAQYQRAEELLQEARDVLILLPPSEHLIECEYRLSVLYRHWSPPHGGPLSLKHARAALEHARQLGVPSKLAWSLGYAAIAESCFAAAGAGGRLAQEALELSARLDAPGPRGMAQFAVAFALEAAGQRHEALRAFKAAEAELLALGVMDAAQEVGLEADRLAGQSARAAERLAWFEAAGMTDLACVARRYFPALGLLKPRVGTIQPRSLAAPPVQQLATLQLDVLGNMQFGPPGAGAAVRGRKRRELLACLLDSRLRGRPEMPRLTLTDALYPGNKEGQAASALKELIHQTRAALGAGIIQTTEGGYALGEVQSDAELFLLSGDTALWRGPYLAGEEPEQGGLMAETLYGALSARTQVLCTEQPAEAARIGRLLCEASPYDPAALALTLRALRAAGNHRSLGRFYASARQGFEEVGEPLPADWAAFLETPGAQAHSPA